MEQGQRYIHLAWIEPFGSRRNGTGLLLQTAAQGGAGGLMHGELGWLSLRSS